MPLPIALTMGEPAGISGEVTLKTWQAAQTHSLPPFFVIGDPDFYREQANIMTDFALSPESSAKNSV